MWIICEDRSALNLERTQIIEIVKGRNMQMSKDFFYCKALICDDYLKTIETFETLEECKSFIENLVHKQNYGF